MKIRHSSGSSILPCPNTENFVCCVSTVVVALTEYREGQILYTSEITTRTQDSTSFATGTRCARDGDMFFRYECCPVAKRRTCVINACSGAARSSNQRRECGNHQRSVGGKDLFPWLSVGLYALVPRRLHFSRNGEWRIHVKATVRSCVHHTDVGTSGPFGGVGAFRIRKECTSC